MTTSASKRNRRKVRKGPAKIQFMSLKRSDLVFVTLIALGFLAAAIWLDVQVTTRVLERFKTGQYQLVRATVIRTEIEQSPSKRPSPNDVHVVIHYRYSVDGTQYEGKHSTFAWGLGRRSREDAERFAARTPAGHELAAYFDPMAPRKSDLMTGMRAEDWAFILFCLVFNFIGLGFSAYIWRCWRPLWQTADRPPTRVTRVGDEVRVNLGIDRRLTLLVVATPVVMTVSLFLTFAIAQISGNDPVPASYFAVAVFASISFGIFAYVWPNRHFLLIRPKLTLTAQGKVLGRGLTGKFMMTRADLRNVYLLNDNEIEAAGLPGDYEYPACRVTARGQSGRTVILTAWKDRDRAKWLLGWLKSQAG